MEQVTATQQMGTHMDALNHLQMGDRTYNGHRLADIVEDHGTNRLGVDTLPAGRHARPAARRRRRARRQRLEPGDVVTPQDARDALDAAGLTVRPATRCCSTPAGGRCGESTTSATAPASRGRAWSWREWLAEQRVAMTGCDTWSYGPYPRRTRPSRSSSRRPSTSATASSWSRTCGWPRRGRAGVHEFLLVISHAKLRGATGAWVAPLAIV